MPNRKISVVFDGETIDAVEAIKSKTVLGGTTDVVRVALKIFNDLLQAEGEGSQIILQERGGRRWQYKMLQEKVPLDEDTQ
jgi:hypothetical protein